MKKLTTILVTSALILGMLFAGCSNHKTDEPRSELCVEPMATEACYADENVAQGAWAGSTADVNYEEAAYDMTPTDPSSTQTPSVSDNRMLIRRVYMSCETTNYDQVVSELLNRVHGAGGYIESSEGYTVNGELRNISYVIRIPSEQLDSVISGIGENATITSSSESTEDVTLQYADTKAMIDSLRIEQETLNELLAQADSLDTLLVLQNELTNVRYQIESYESQLRVLENQSSLSTLTINISEVLEETEIEAPHVKTYGEKVAETFEDMLDNTKEFFEDLFLDIIENLPGIVVFIVIALAIFITIKVLIAKRRKKNKKIASPKADEQNINSK